MNPSTSDQVDALLETISRHEIVSRISEIFEAKLCADVVVIYCRPEIKAEIVKWATTRVYVSSVKETSERVTIKWNEDSEGSIAFFPESIERNIRGIRGDYVFFDADCGFKLRQTTIVPLLANSSTRAIVYK